MVYGEYVKQRIVSRPFITMDRPLARALGREGISVSCVGVHTLLVKYQGTEAAARRTGSGRPRKVTGTINTTRSTVKREY